jgi:hypothetical protein
MMSVGQQHKLGIVHWFPQATGGGKLRSDSIGKGSETRSRRLIYRKGSENSDTHPIKHLNVFRFASFWLLGVAHKNPILSPSLPIPIMIGLTLRNPVGTVVY